MWSSDLPLVKQEKPMVYPSPEPSLYSKPSKLWGQPTGRDAMLIEEAEPVLPNKLAVSQEAPDLPIRAEGQEARHE